MAQIIRNQHCPYIEIKTGDDGRFAVKNHSHDELSIGFVYRGGCRIACRGIDVELTENQAVIFPPGAIHLCAPHDPEKYCFSIIYIDCKWFSGVFDYEPASLLPKVVTLDSDAIAIQSGFIENFDQFEDPLTAESETILFLNTVVHNIFKSRQQENKEEIRSNKMDQVKEHLDRYFTDQISLDELADIYGKSKYSLLRQFKRDYRLTPHAYLINKRINQAKMMLQQDFNIARTAVECGFFDQSHFIKVFRNFTGMNPSDYKEG